MGEEDPVKRVEEWREWMHRNPPPEPQPLGPEPCDNDYAEEYLNRMWDISVELERLNKNIRLLALLQALQVMAIFLYLVLRWSR
ncbi:MAG: hypothetical protein QXV17_02615 [Candidatus Micrarchaeaceae archaeon]